MSSVGNWIKRAEKQPYCAGERSQHTCDRAPAPVNVRWVNNRPILANVRTRASFNPTGALDNLNATPSLLVEVGN
jgi:hypothetical protein